MNIMFLINGEHNSAQTKKTAQTNQTKIFDLVLIKFALVFDQANEVIGEGR